MGAFRGRSAVAAAAVTLTLAAPGCRTLLEGGTERFAVQPGVAFSMLRDAPYLPVIDLRPAAEFHGPLGHLARARSLPLDDLDARRAELRAYEEITVLVYCRAAECGRPAYERLSAFAIDDPVFIDGGIEAWIAAGFGTVHRDLPAGEPCPGLGEPPPFKP
jgi:rhodanese-related sulfurtransferase